MMIVPSNPDHVRRMAKAYKKQLSTDGYDYKFSFLLEAVSKMLGHHSHNHLLDAAFELDPTPRTSEVSAEVVEERLRTMTDRLSAILEIPDEVARSLVERYDPVVQRPMAGDATTGVMTRGTAER